MALAQQLHTQTPQVGSQAPEDGRLLDGFLLLAAGGSASPDDASPNDVVSVNLSSLQIVEVVDEDLVFFGHLDHLDLSDNQLNYEHILHHLGSLPRLSSLVLACNSISSLQVPSNCLNRLHKLDLSFNELHGDVLALLANLPSLTFLNLASNCVSSLPPDEDLYGLQALEELILDSNDLVQFVQWRALDAIPGLRKLSLASNRIKRLKDDAPESIGDELSYFPSLEELDLSSNEIASLEGLQVVQTFQRLHTLRLNDNPCGQGLPAQHQSAVIPGIHITFEKTKPWYLCGSGCHQRRQRAKEPRLKLDRKKLRKVRSSPQLGTMRKKTAFQIGVLDSEANQLLISLPPGTKTSALGQTRGLQTEQSLGLAQEELGDDYSDDELDRMFRERREKLEKKLSTQVDEPQSFMRPPPFEVSPAAAVKLGLASAPEESPAALTKKPSVFLTSVGDEPLEAPRLGSVAQRSEGRLRTPAPAEVAPALPPPPASPQRVVLPPIQAGSRGSSAGSGRHVERVGDAGLQKPVPDKFVRDAMKAMRALHAASKSQYAVAA